MNISYWKLWMNLQCSLQWSLISSIIIQDITRWFHLFWFLYINNQNVKQGWGKGDRQQIRNFKYKRKHKIGCYSKYLLIFTAYQVQWWWTMILIPIKDQTGGNNSRGIILKISWNTHLKNSMQYTFILQKFNKPPDGFFTHLLFAS